MDKYVSPYPLPDEHMRMVGIIAAHWEHLELMLERAVAETSDHAFPRVAMLTANLGFRSKCDILMAHARVFQTGNEVIWKDFTSILEEIKNAYTARNTYVHAKWKSKDPNKLGHSIHRVSGRTTGGRFTVVDESVPIEDMYRAAHQIHTAAERFVGFCQTFGLLQP